MSTSRSQAPKTAIHTICLAILMLIALLTGCDAHSTHQCKAVFLDGQGGNVIGEVELELDSASLGERSPENACVVSAAKESPDGMMAILCTCDSVE